MHDLFDTALIPGLRLQPNFITPSEERELIARIEAESLQPFRFQQWTGKRLVKSFGWEYDFQSGAANRTAPIPDWLLFLRDRAASFAALDPAALDQALLLKYGEGAGIGWHRDRPIYDQVLGISLGAPVWEHSIVEMEAATRYSITFRNSAMAASRNGRF